MYIITEPFYVSSHQKEFAGGSKVYSVNLSLENANLVILGFCLWAESTTKSQAKPFQRHYSAVFMTRDIKNRPRRYWSDPRPKLLCFGLRIKPVVRIGL